VCYGMRRGILPIASVLVGVVLGNDCLRAAT